MRRHLIGIGLAIAMILAMFLAGAWGYVRLLRLPASAGAPVSALPAQGGSLLSSGGVLGALAALAATALLGGILVAVPRISPLAAGLAGLFALAWQALFLVSVRHTVQLIPFRAHAFGAGWEALLFNGILGAAGLVMVIPLFLPSRWRGHGGYTDADEAEASDYMADLKDTVNSDAQARTPAGVGAGAASRGGMASGMAPGRTQSLAQGTGPRPAQGTGPRPASASGPGAAAGIPGGAGITRGTAWRRGGAPTAVNPIPSAVNPIPPNPATANPGNPIAGPATPAQGAVPPARPSRTGLVGGPRPGPAGRMRPRPYRPYRRSANDQ